MRRIPWKNVVRLDLIPFFPKSRPSGFMRPFNIIFSALCCRGMSTFNSNKKGSVCWRGVYSKPNCIAIFVKWSLHTFTLTRFIFAVNNFSNYLCGFLHRPSNTYILKDTIYLLDYLVGKVGFELSNGLANETSANHQHIFALN